MSGRGLVVFPARRQAAPGRPPSHWIAGYLPFLVTIAAGAVVVVIIGILIGH
jgi:prepilin signal peptidase PulO-like enzyme (type II secretory pathway)